MENALSIELICVLVFAVSSIIFVLLREVWKYYKYKKRHLKKIRFPYYKDGFYINIHQLKDEELHTLRIKVLTSEDSTDKELLGELELEMELRHLSF